MNKRAAPTPGDLAPARGILRAPRPDGILAGERRRPPEALAPFVHHFWSLAWSLASPFTAEALPHPSIQILVDESPGRMRARVMGVSTGRLARRLTGEGRTFGIAFRPAMFQPLLGRATSVASLTDQVVPLARLLGPNGAAWAGSIQRAKDVGDRIALTEAFLVPRLAPACSRGARVRDLVERIASDPSLRRVEDVCAASGTRLRALQRAFQVHVGVSPKWVLQRYRLLEATAQLSGPRPPPLAALAASLGYADQAHFGRDFKRAIGETPRAFGVEAQRRGR